MEKISGISGYGAMEGVSFSGFNKGELSGCGEWEIVFFLFPYCNSTCTHCWSSSTMLGRSVPLNWHRKFWMNLNPNKIKEIRLTGGEPFLYKQIGDVISSIRSYLGEEVPIIILTNGMEIMSLLKGARGTKESVENLRRRYVISKNIEIHMSADEHHAGSLYRRLSGIKKRPGDIGEIRKMNNLGVPLIQNMTKNFLQACNILYEESDGLFGGGKIKVHAEFGRMTYHRNIVFDWMDDEMWNKYVIATEGIIHSGYAVNLENTIRISPSSMLSIFIFPGAEFTSLPRTKFAQRYEDPISKNSVFLDLSKQDYAGAAILGWWNVINRIYCGGTIQETIDLINGSK